VALPPCGDRHTRHAPLSPISSSPPTSVIFLLSPVASVAAHIYGFVAGMICGLLLRRGGFARRH
jgi:membrane associated rhomboid family serine protease